MSSLWHLGKADAQREGDRHVAARGRTVHDFLRQCAAPRRNVSVSTDLLGRTARSSS